VDKKVNLAKQQTPDVILLDIRMPCGWEVLSLLKSDPELSTIPVVIVTIEDDQALGSSFGSRGLFAETVDYDQLLTLLQPYCTNSAPTSVLVVEDNPENREIVRQLTKAGWRVFGSGERATGVGCDANRTTWGDLARSDDARNGWV